MQGPVVKREWYSLVKDATARMRAAMPSSLSNASRLQGMTSPPQMQPTWLGYKQVPSQENGPPSSHRMAQVRVRFRRLRIGILEECTKMRTRRLGGITQAMLRRIAPGFPEGPEKCDRCGCEESAPHITLECPKSAPAWQAAIAVAAEVAATDIYGDASLQREEASKRKNLLTTKRALTPAKEV